jgi:glycosyltransferase involved in cell wall biosynthesis
MRVGFDARWYNDSGVGTYVAELVKALVPLQQNFHLIVYEDPSRPLPGLDGQPVERVQVRAAKYSLSGQMELMRRCAQDRLDVFHSPFFPLPLAASCPVVVTFHDLIPFLFRTYKWPKQFAIRMGYRAAAFRSTHVIAVSGQTAGDLRRILGIAEEKISIIHNAAAPTDFHPNVDAAEISYLHKRYGIRCPYAVAASARNWRTKNLGSALQALALARNQTGIEFQTVVFGPEDGLRALNSQGADGALQLVRTGFMPARELGMLFRHSHFFIMPSLYEGFGLPIVEAMACGCAVLTSNAGALVEVAGSGAQTFSPFDIHAMASAAAKLLQFPEELNKWKERAIQRAADFSWSKSAEATLSAYCRILRQNDAVPKS